MPVAIGLLLHGLSYWVSVLLLQAGPMLTTGWFACYGAGVVFLGASIRYSRLHLSPTQSLQLIGYSVLLAVMLFGANSARAILGNSVRVNHLHEAGIPPHFLLAPGVASVGIGALVASVLRRRGSARALDSREA